MSTKTVKRERLERKADEVQIKIVSSNTYIINIAPVEMINENSLDAESEHGRFGWVVVEEKTHLPYIIRKGEKYCAVRMVEVKILSPFLGSINHDIYYGCTNIPSYYITESERRLLNEINAFHCEYQFGKIAFSQKDLIIRLSDAIEFYKFMVVCYRKIFNVNPLSGNCGFGSNNCGFVMIDNASVVPYVIYNEEKYFPLFYFEGAEHLQANAKLLKGWHLSYLKFCYKIQGIRDEYVKQETCAAVGLNEVKECFPPNTVFKDFWPRSVAALRRFPGNNGNSQAWYRLPSLQQANCNNFIQTPTATSVC